MIRNVPNEDLRLKKDEILFDMLNLGKVFRSRGVELWEIDPDLQLLSRMPVVVRIRID